MELNEAEKEKIFEELVGPVQEGDMDEINKKKEEMKKLSERLETDEEFQKKYIEEQKAASKRGFNELLKQCQKYGGPQDHESLQKRRGGETSHDDSEDLPDIMSQTEDLPTDDNSDDNGSSKKSNKNGVYIHRVEKLVIKISL